MPVIPEILEEHLDEASFHWLRWEKALRSSEHDLPDTAAQEERLMAHLGVCRGNGKNLLEA